jgi:hypothetical protein
MKTKIILLLAVSLFFIANIQAQTYYYNTSKTFSENGYTYKCDVTDWKKVTLYNKNNKYTYAEQTHKDGSYLTIEEQLDRNPTVENDNWTRQYRENVVNSALSPSLRERVKNHRLIVTMIVDPSSGNVIEVYFKFGSIQGYATVPVSVYRQIETEIIKNVWYIPTEKGKNLNYIMLSWSHQVKEPKPLFPPLQNSQVN